MIIIVFLFTLVGLFNYVECSPKFYMYDWPQFVNRYANFSDRPHHGHGVEFPLWANHHGAGRVLSKNDMEYKTSQFALYKLMYERALIDPKRTLNPDEATSFLIPYDFGMDATFFEANGRMRKTACPLATEAKQLLLKSSHFQRNFGHDHTLIVSVNQNMNYFFNAQNCLNIFHTCWNCTKVAIDEYMFIARDRNYELKNRGINWHAVPFPSDYHYDDTLKRLTSSVSNGVETPAVAIETQIGDTKAAKLKIKGTKSAHNLASQSTASVTTSATETTSNITTAASRLASLQEPIDLTAPWERVNENRPIIVSFLGNPRKFSKISTQIREALVLQCGNHTAECSHGAYKHEPKQELQLTTQQIQHKSSPNYESRHSVFCLQPPGDMPTRKSVFDSILSGCIPVLFHPLTARLMYEWHFNQTIWEAIGIHYDTFEDNHLIVTNQVDYVQTLIDIYHYNYTSVVLKKRELIRQMAYSLQYSLVYRNNNTNVIQVSQRHRQGDSLHDPGVVTFDPKTLSSNDLTGKLDAYDITMYRILEIHSGLKTHNRTSDYLVCAQIPGGGGSKLQTADYCNSTYSNHDPFGIPSVVSVLYKGKQ